MIFSFGTRNSFGLFLEPVSTFYEWERTIFATAIAVQNLIWGLSQPFFGGLADRYGENKILSIGAFLYFVGILGMALCTTEQSLYLTLGLLCGIGLSGASITIVIAAVTKIAPTNRRSFFLGLITAAGSLGQFIVVPATQFLISTEGWKVAAVILAIMVLLIPAFSLGFRNETQKEISRPTKSEITTAYNKALRHKSYLLLLLGFFVCGFHVAFITNHLPAYIHDLGINRELGALAISIIGLFNVVGASASGYLGGIFSKKNLLSLLYLLRALVMSYFLLAPTTEFNLIVFSGLIGLLWLSTVPLTSGLVSVMFGQRYMGSLYGLVFLAHQLGAFFGVILGGIIFSIFNSYDYMWVCAIGLSILASAIHLPIKENSVPMTKTWQIN